MLWVTNRIVRPSSRQTRRSSSLSRSRVISSSAPNGSSISRIFGSLTSARAIDDALAHAARQLVRIGRFAALQADQLEQLARRRLAAAGARSPPPASGSSTFCSAVRHGSSAGSWNTKPMSRRRRAACGVAEARRCAAVGRDQVGD